VNFGTLLQRDLGFTPVWVRYNTGRHVSENGQELNAKLEALIASWPIEPSDVVLIGHSMGGLVVRSASHYAKETGSKWIARVRRIFLLSSPHRGAALEKFGHLATAVLGAIDTPATRIPALILRGRSAGIKDMRHGSLVDDDWLGRDLDALTAAAARSIPLLDGIEYHFVSASITSDPDHPLGKLVGDVFVHAWSASGPTCSDHAFRIETRHYGGVMHHQLQNHPDVYEHIRAACSR
jgi:pimeloyl-ACP methyl ester carboxylesterase